MRRISMDDNLQILLEELDMATIQRFQIRYLQCLEVHALNFLACAALVGSPSRWTSTKIHKA